jgi:hypothetical protein
LQKVFDGAKEPRMDLGRPLARHQIRRPHEVIDLDEVAIDADAAPEDQPTAQDRPLSTETPDR